MKNLRWQTSLLGHKHRVDIILLIIFPLVATFLTLYLDLNYINATLLFFGVPSVYLSIKNPARIKRSLIFTTLLFIFFSFVIDYPAYIDGSWFVPNSVYRILGNSTPVEDLLWAFLWVYFAITFWEYFLDVSGAHKHFSKNLKYFLVLGAVSLVGFFGAYFFKPDILNEPYFYLKFGLILLVLPIVGTLLRFHRLIPKIFAIGVYFFFVSFLAELVGLKEGHWYFNGENFVVTFNFLGHKLPLEEIIFWWSLGVPGIICWYELFGDDRK